MKKVLIASGVAVLAFVAIAGAQSTTFNANLTVGSTGADVSALQTWLMANGYSIPAISAGTAKGYFGSQTKSAVAAYQVAKGIINPGTGFFGPLTRAVANGGTVTPVAVGCPVGYTCTANPGTTPVIPGTSGVITTPGVEGSISATQYNAGLPSTIYEGQLKASVLAAKVEAKTSDMRVERVKLDLGTATTIFNKIYQKVYVTDGDTILASSDLNSSTVVKDGSRYYITLGGINLVIPKDSSKVITIKFDVRPSIDSTDLSSNYTVRLAANGIRAIDGAGIDQYAPEVVTDVTRAQNVDATLSDTATLTISTNSATPAKQDVVATAGSNEDEYSKLSTLVFDVKAEKDAVKITDIAVTVAKAGTGGATASTTAYLFDGTTELNSADVSDTTGIATISDSNGLITVPAGTTKTLTIKLDIAGANATVSNITTSIASGGITSENTVGDGVTESGSATGFQIGVRNQGPVITLTSRSLTPSALQSDTTNIMSTSTLTASFNVHIVAVGGPIMFGSSQASSRPFFASTSPTTNGSKSYTVYVNGVADTTVGSVATSTSFTFPSTCSTAGYTNSCVLPEGSSIDVPISLELKGRRASGAALTAGLYSVGISALNWSGGPTNFMSGETTWITPEVSFP
jgi:peptidoglycan hydrolase-like protein with peptidoglycan-binding domain